MRRRKFQPPKVSDPPRLVVVEWVDAVHSNGESSIGTIGGLKRLPCGGYHVRTALKGPHGPFVVIALEHDRDDEGAPTARFHLSIPTAWIVSWTEVHETRQIWPEPEEPSTSTSSTIRPTTKTEIPESTT
jgi:hypothetical protein